MIKKLLIGIGILIVSILLFNSVLMPLYVKHTTLVKVPNVLGISFTDAKRILEDAGLEVKQGDLKYDELKPIGQVLDQNPPSEQYVKGGRRVYLTVCGGEQLMEVPKLSGKSLRDAKFTLEQRNLKLGEVAKKFSYEFQEDIVISQVVQPGSKVKKNTTIDLIVSNGIQIGSITVPDFIGKKLEDAKKLITDTKLKLGKITYLSSDSPPGQVIDQYPKKDKSANESTSIDLIVAKKRKDVKKEELEEPENENTSKPPEKTIDKEKKETDKSKETKTNVNPADTKEKTTKTEDKINK
jgi:eukaryotic-like serine/threonine-protein kinase